MAKVWVIITLVIFFVENITGGFYQTGYTLEHDYIELVDINKKQVINVKLRNIKQNRTYRTFGGDFQLVKQINQMTVIAQAFVFVSNQYKLMAPIRLSGDVCKSLISNDFGIATILEKRHSNVSMCPIKPGPYSIFSWIPDPTKFPPHLPQGAYKMEISFTTEKIFVATIAWYGKIVNL